MALPTSYLITVKNLTNFLNSIISAQAPERFTNKFLIDLGFASSNDRLFIGVLKMLNFLDEGGAPTNNYYHFIDQTQSKKVLASAIKEAYKDLFALKKDAYNYSIDEVKNKMKTLTEGQKSANVIGCMATTFKALCDYADFRSPNLENVAKSLEDINKKETKEISADCSNCKKTELHYNIQIHLPETRDIAVYDAIFQSLKKHIL